MWFFFFIFFRLCWPLILLFVLNLNKTRQQCDPNNCKRHVKMLHADCGSYERCTVYLSFFSSVKFYILNVNKELMLWGGMSREHFTREQCAAVRSMYGIFEMAEWKERNEPLIIASDKKHWRNGFETFVVSNFMCGIMANVQQRYCLHLSTAVARTCLEQLWCCALLEHFITAFCNISQFQK